METSQLAQTIATLTRGPGVFDALLRGLPEAQENANEGGNTWSPREVLIHLIHCEHVDWMVRVHWLLEHGEAGPFPPFDREGGRAEFAGKPLASLLEEFARARAASIDALRALDLQPADLERRSLHPAFGAVTLAQLLATWTVHDLTHLHQLTRVLAHQQREAVGPWKAYIGVLRCEGHGG